jgi:hypothetical protein
MAWAAKEAPRLALLDGVRQARRRGKAGEKLVIASGLVSALSGVNRNLSCKMNFSLEPSRGRLYIRG